MTDNSSHEKPTPPTINYWHVWTDQDGISHQSRCQIQDFTLKSISPPASPQWLDQMQQAGATVVFTVMPVGWVGSWQTSGDGCWRDFIWRRP